MLAIIILAEHLISRLPGDNRFTNGLYTFQIKSEQSIENILSALEIDINDYKCIEENIEELVNLL